MLVELFVENYSTLLLLLIRLFRFDSLDIHLIVIKVSCANGLLRQPQRHIQYRFSPPADSLVTKAQPNVKIKQNSAEWQYVDAILAPLTVPTSAVKAEYPLEWLSQTIDSQKTKYFIVCSKNHMMPAYSCLTFRNTRRQTIVRRIQGDIWKLENDSWTHLGDHMKKKMSIRVNEFSETIIIVGDYVNVENYITEKGFRKCRAEEREEMRIV